LKRAVSINGITFDYKLFISSEFDMDDYIGSRQIAIDGSSVMYIQPKGAMSKEVKLYSKTSGIISETTKGLLEQDVDENIKNIVFDDASNGDYYYDLTKTAIEFEPLYEGSEWYSVTINLVKG